MNKTWQFFTRHRLGPFDLYMNVVATGTNRPKRILMVNTDVVVPSAQRRAIAWVVKKARTQKPAPSTPRGSR